jgi:hypothetical protein
VLFAKRPRYAPNADVIRQRLVLFSVMVVHNKLDLQLPSQQIMGTRDLLRFQNKATFQEAEPPEDRSRPLEWRRSFNTISFTAKQLQVEYVYTINEIDYLESMQEAEAGEREPADATVVTPVGRRRLRVVCKVPQESIRDSILVTEEKDKEANIYALRRTKAPIELTLTDSEPTEQRGPYATGAYPGLTFHNSLEPGDDNLCMEVSVPTSHLQEIASALKAESTLALQVAVSIQSFSYEVDDALREWYHPRDLFIHGHSAPTALQSLRLVHLEPEPTDDVPLEQDEPYQEVTPENQTPSQLPAIEPPYGPVLKSIKTALWVVVVLLIFHLIK